VIVTSLERLYPRYWDGQRFLRFLTGLALLALAFAAPVGPAADAPAAAPAPAPVTTIAERAPAAAEPAAAQPVAAQSAAAQSVATQPASAQPAETCRHDASGYSEVDQPADVTTAIAGIAPRAAGPRAPPRA
jgi:hypothetical protein